MVAIWIADAACTGLGVCYPAYTTFKVLKRKNMREYQEVIMYWIVYAAFVSITFITDLFLSWLPFYYELKIGFVVWMSVPGSKGHYYIYKQFIHHRLNEHEPAIDEMLTDIGGHFQDLSRKMGQSAAAVAVDSLNKSQAFLATQIANQASTNNTTNDAPFELLSEEDLATGNDSLIPHPPPPKMAQARATVRRGQKSARSRQTSRQSSEEATVKTREFSDTEIPPTRWQTMKSFFVQG